MTRMMKRRLTLALGGGLVVVLAAATAGSMAAASTTTTTSTTPTQASTTTLLEFCQDHEFCGAPTSTVPVFDPDDHDDASINTAIDALEATTTTVQRAPRVTLPRTG